MQTSRHHDHPNLPYDPMLAPTKPRICPAGLHCYEGTSALQPTVTGRGNYSTPQPCFQGFFCPPGSYEPQGFAGACPLGKYCPTPRHSGVVCPERYMCGTLPGAFEPLPCPEGTYNPFAGQTNCTLCENGGICPSSRMRQPQPCPCGYECTKRGSSQTIDKCPAGVMCDEGTASIVEPV